MTSESVQLTDEDKGVFETARKVFSGELNMEQVKDFYDDWVTTYEKDCVPGRYNAHLLAAEAVNSTYPENRDQIILLDVAAGTGMLGEELLKSGFKHLHALDASEGMLNKAKEKDIYEKIYCDFLTENPLPIEQDTYDCSACSGGFGAGHIPSGALKELVRLTKPGGMIIFSMREEFLNSEEYRDKLEPMMQQLETSGKWTREERSVVPNYFCGKNGIVYRFKVI
ncbi:hypothetical protein FSP39_010123 [Pinctada imbricata]|uniref:Methyltransferase domain-containing protein n=1 Tax=Pinctada imbricata TaxID=66713 RepID=A0AA88XLU8_PINIB|nr:hypothetical protein FSP39_010123 [Pinctada imbricata]